MADQILDPDVKAVLNRVAAPKRLIEKMVQDMLEGGDYQQPEPFMDLQTAMLTAQAMYLEALEDGSHSPAELRNVRKFMNGISSLVMISKQKQQEAQQAALPPSALLQPGAMPGQPQLPPGAMPPGAAPPGAPIQ
jgi:hypothetical protein